MGTTHLPLGSLGAVLTVLLAAALHLPLPATTFECVLLAVIVGGIGGLLPDLDRATSLVANPGRTADRMLDGAVRGRRANLLTTIFGWLAGLILNVVTGLLNLPVAAAANVIEDRLGHRGPLHSIVAAALLAVGYSGLVMLLTGMGCVVWLAVFLAYLALTLACALIVTLAAVSRWLAGAALVGLACLSFGITPVLANSHLWLALTSLDLHGLAAGLTAVWQAGARWQLVGVLLFAGILTHLLGDGTTRSSVRCLLWPLAYTKADGRRVRLIPWPLSFRPWPEPLRVRADGWLNRLLGSLFVVSVALLVLAAGWQEVIRLLGIGGGR